eukprot:5286672-Pleurochrysis_carterae.AAC.2
MHVEPMVFAYALKRDEFARKPIEDFIRSFGIPIKLAEAEGMEEVSKSLSGHDCRIFAERTGEIFPDLLEFALAPQEAIQAAVAGTAAAARESLRVRAATCDDTGNHVFAMRRGGCDEDDDEENSEEDGNDEDKDSRKLQFALSVTFHLYGA